MNQSKNNIFFYSQAGVRLASFIVIFMLFFLSEAKAQLSASFSYSMQSSCLKPGEGVIVKFTNETTGGNYVSDWNFGDGAGSKASNPIKVYTDPGVYYVNLTTKNAANDVSSFTKQIIIYPSPTIVFSTDINKGCSPLKVNLTDKSLPSEIKDPATGKTYFDKIASWAWDFGDGNKASTTVPTVGHTYTLPGNRKVTLTLGTENGCKVSSESAGDFIQVIDNAIADFYIPAANSCKFPLTVQASNFSATGLAYKWDVTGTGDAVISNSTDFSPFITFLQSGSYRITLTVTNQTGCADVLNYDYVLPPSQIVNIFSAPDSACDKSTVNFINQSNPEPISQSWYINGVKQASTKDLSYQFPTTGSYLVKLESQFGTCNTSFEKSIRIFVDFSFLA